MSEVFRKRKEILYTLLLKESENSGKSAKLETVYDDHHHFQSEPEEEETEHTACLICSSSVTLLCSEVSSKKEAFPPHLQKVTGPPDSNCLEPHLYSIFVLRNLLNFPKAECEQLLGKVVVHPGDWYRLCGPCALLVEQCMEVHRQIALLQQKLGDYRTEAYEKLQTSFAAEKISTTKSATTTCVREVVRDYFKGHLPPPPPLVVKEEVEPLNLENTEAEEEADFWDDVDFPTPSSPAEQAIPIPEDNTPVSSSEEQFL